VYNILTSTLVIKFMLSSVHESITDIIYNEFSAARKSLSEAWDFNIISNQNFMRFIRQYSESFKISDLVIKFINSAWDI